MFIGVQSLDTVGTRTTGALLSGQSYRASIIFIHSSGLRGSPIPLSCNRGALHGVTLAFRLGLRLREDPLLLRFGDPVSHGTLFPLILLEGLLPTLALLLFPVVSLWCPLV